MLAIVLIGVSVWVVDRWDAWFAIPDESSYVPEVRPERLMLTFGDRTKLSRNISWRCDTVLKHSFLELCLGEQSVLKIPTQGEIFESRAGKAAYYVCKLRELLPDTIYRYRVCTNNEYSDWHTFHTYPSDREQFAFLYTGDVQETDGSSINTWLRKGVYTHQPEFIVCAGDLTERPADSDWAETFKTLDSIAQVIPILTVTGNHDYLKSVPRKLEKRFSLVFSYFLDSMVGENQVYALRYGNAELFVLDSNREFNYLWEQRRWLVERLQSSDAYWKILVLHHPLHSIKGKANNLIQKWMFDDVVKGHGVDLVLQGHEHAYARMATLDENGQKSTPVYWVSHCSPKHYQILFDERYDRYGISSRYYQMVRVSSETLSVAAYELETGALYDSVVIAKPALGARGVVMDYALGIPENMSFQPRSGSKKDYGYEERILEYIQAHPEKEFKR